MLVKWFGGFIVCLFVWSLMVWKILQLVTFEKVWNRFKKWRLIYLVIIVLWLDNSAIKQRKGGFIKQIPVGKCVFNAAVSWPLINKTSADHVYTHKCMWMYVE